MVSRSSSAPLPRCPVLGLRVHRSAGPVLHLKALAAPLSRPEMGSTCPGRPYPARSRFRRVSLPLVSAPELGTRPHGGRCPASSPMKNFPPDPLIETRDFFAALACREEFAVLALPFLGIRFPAPVGDYFGAGRLLGKNPGNGFVGCCIWKHSL